LWNELLTNSDQLLIKSKFEDVNSVTLGIVQNDVRLEKLQCHFKSERGNVPLIIFFIIPLTWVYLVIKCI